MSRAAERLIASRFAVASTSDCPPERKTMPGTRRGRAGGSSERRLRDLSGLACAARCLPGMTMFGLSSIPSSSTRCRSKARRTPRERPRGHLVAALDRVVGVHQDLGLDDRQEPGLLAQCGVAASACALTWRQARTARLADRDIARHLRTGRRAGGTPRSGHGARRGPRSPSRLAARERVGAGVTLIPGTTPLTSRSSRERRPLVRGLPDRLVKQDHPADVVLEAGVVNNRFR